MEPKLQPVMTTAAQEQGADDVMNFAEWMAQVKDAEEKIEGKRRDEGAHYLPWWREVFDRGLSPEQAVYRNGGDQGP